MHLSLAGTYLDHDINELQELYVAHNNKAPGLCFACKEENFKQSPCCPHDNMCLLT